MTIRRVWLLTHMSTFRHYFYIRHVAFWVITRCPWPTKSSSSDATLPSCSSRASCFTEQSSSCLFERVMLRSHRMRRDEIPIKVNLQEIVVAVDATFPRAFWGDTIWEKAFWAKAFLLYIYDINVMNPDTRALDVPLS